MDGIRGTRGFDGRHGGVLPIRHPVPADTALQACDAWLAALAARAQARCDGGTAQFRDESTVFDDLLAFAAGIRRPGRGRWDRASRAEG